MGQYHPDLSKQATLFSGHNYNIFEILGASFAKEVGSCKETIGDRKVESITIFDKNPSPTRIHLRQVSISDKYPSPTSIHLRQVSSHIEEHVPGLPEDRLEMFQFPGCQASPTGEFWTSATFF
ncbi:hypothetical protein E4U26_000585 [Claviceps purpurea]|nr:hypothetical protein E4U26_000585 [Claviceps purpurea]